MCLLFYKGISEEAPDSQIFEFSQTVCYGNYKNWDKFQSLITYSDFMVKLFTNLDQVQATTQSLINITSSIREQVKAAFISHNSEKALDRSWLGGTAIVL